MKTGKEDAKKQLVNVPDEQAQMFEQEVETAKSNWNFVKPQAIAEKKQEKGDEKKQREGEEKKW